MASVSCCGYTGEGTWLAVAVATATAVAARHKLGGSAPLLRPTQQDQHGGNVCGLQQLLAMVAAAIVLHTLASLLRAVVHQQLNERRHACPPARPACRPPGPGCRLRPPEGAPNPHYDAPAALFCLGTEATCRAAASSCSSPLSGSRTAHAAAVQHWGASTAAAATGVQALMRTSSPPACLPRSGTPRLRRPTAAGPWLPWRASCSPRSWARPSGSRCAHLLAPVPLCSCWA